MNNSEFTSGQRIVVCKAIRRSLYQGLAEMQMEKPLYMMCMNERLLKKLVDEAAQELEDGEPLPEVYGVDMSGDWRGYC